MVEVARGVEVDHHLQREGVHESAPLAGQAAMVAPAKTQLSQRLPEVRGGEEGGAGTQPRLKENVDELIGEPGGQVGGGGEGRGEEGVSHTEEVFGDGFPGRLGQLAAWLHEN